MGGAEFESGIPRSWFFYFSSRLFQRGKCYLQSVYRQKRYGKGSKTSAWKLTAKNHANCSYDHANCSYDHANCSYDFSGENEHLNQVLDKLASQRPGGDSGNEVGDSEGGDSRLLGECKNNRGENLNLPYK